MNWKMKHVFISLIQAGRHSGEFLSKVSRSEVVDLNDDCYTVQVKADLVIAFFLSQMHISAVTPQVS